MGGNSRAIDIETGTVLAYAERVDFRRVDRSHFRSVVIRALRCLNALHEKQHGEPIWRWAAFELLMASGMAFNGSSEHVMGRRLLDDELICYKPVIGDIDVTVPHNRLKTLFSTLESCRATHERNAGDGELRLESELPHREFSYIGQNKPEQHGHQINALFKYRFGPKRTDVIAVQVDFEGTEYRGGVPTVFSKFAHSSSWDDIKLGLKGVGHKFWLTNLVRAISERDDIVLLTEKSPLPPAPVRLKKLAPSELPRTHAFSVDRGLRSKIAWVNGPDGSPVTIDGKAVCRELSAKDSTYTRELREIFGFLFGKHPVHTDIDAMRSLSGLASLCKKYMVDRPTVIDRAYLLMLHENLFGPGAQKLDRTSWKVDEEIKMKIVLFLKASFQFLSTHDDKLDAMKNEYYRNY